MSFLGRKRINRDACLGRLSSTTWTAMTIFNFHNFHKSLPKWIRLLRDSSQRQHMNDLESMNTRDYGIFRCKPERDISMLYKEKDRTNRKRNLLCIHKRGDENLNKTRTVRLRSQAESGRTMRRQWCTTINRLP